MCGLQVPDRQAGHEVLRLHAQHLVRRHRQDQIDRLAAHLSDTTVGRGTSGGTARPRGLRPLVELFAIPERIADPGAFGIEPDIPGEL